MIPESKDTWKDYYQHYNGAHYMNHTIIKCDDDIVFIDIERLPMFIEKTRMENSPADIIYANTINNGVAAYYQQYLFHLIPEEVGVFEYPAGGYGGTLWESGEKAAKLHVYFMDNYRRFLENDYSASELVDIHTRFSINFFAIKGENWHKIADAYLGSDNGTDEYNISVAFRESRGLTTAMYAPFYVSHLSFYQQRHFSLDHILTLYAGFYQMQLKLPRLKN